MTITNPDLFDRPIASRTGTLTAASQIVKNNGSNVEDNLNDISDLFLRQTFDNTLGDDPAANSFSRDNADRTAVKIIYTDINWNEGVFNEWLIDMPVGTYIYQQSFSTPANNVLYKTTGRITAGTGNSWYIIPVSHVRSEGDDFTANDEVVFQFLIGPAPASVSRGTVLPIRFTEDFIVTQTNIQNALSRPLYYTAARDKTDVDLIFRISGLTQDGVGNSLVYPLEFFAGHIGGTSPSSTTNSFRVQFQDQNNANAVIPIRLAGASSTTNSRILSQGDVLVFRVDAPDSTEIAALITSTIDPRAVVQFDLNTDIQVNATSPTTFQQSFTGEIPDAGEQYRVTVGGNPFDGVEANPGDVFESLVANPGLTNPDNWAIIRRSVSFPVNALESRYLGGLSEDSDIQIVENYADIAAEIRLQLYDERTDYTAADLNTNGDVDVYKNPTDLGNHYLGVRLAGQNATLLTILPTLYAVIDRSDGSQDLIGSLGVSADFTYEGDFGVESDYLSVNAITYFAGDSIRIYTTTTQPNYLVQNYDSSKNLPDNSITEPKFSQLVRDKLNRQSPTDNALEQRIRNLESKVEALFPLTPDVSDLTAWATAFSPSNTTQIVRITQGYSLLADYRGDATRYESAGVTYDATGTNVVRYTGLSNNLHRGVGCKVTAPSNKTLVSLVEGSEIIPLIDMTTAGNFRINQYTFSTTAGVPVTRDTRFLTRTAGVEQLTAGEGNVSTFTIPNFPTNSTETSRTFQVDLNIFVNGTDTLAAGFVNPVIPQTNVAQARRTISRPVPLGPLYGNRRVTVVISYEFRVSGNDLLVDFRLVSAPSDVTVRIDDVETTLAYTPASTTTRTDRFSAITDQLGAYTFSSEAELLVSFQPQNGNSINAVPVVRQNDGTVVQLNDIRIPVPVNGFDSLQIPDDIDFRTFEAPHYLRHFEIASLVTRTNTQWVYGLAEEVPISEDQVTDLIDFTNGIVLIDTVTSARQRLIVTNGVLSVQTVT